MDRFLEAPLSDEPASVLWTNDGRKKQASPGSITRAASVSRGYHSQETSAGVNSDSQWTFFTPGSAPDTPDTSYTTHSKDTPRRKLSQTPIEIPPILQRQVSPFSGASSPDTPTTRNIVVPAEMTRSWAEQMEKYMPGFSPDGKIDYRAKIDEDIARIQERAMWLKQRMRLYEAERDAHHVHTQVVTDEVAYARMAAQPKLAWILGEEHTHVIDGLSPVSRTTDDIPDRSSTTGKPDSTSNDRVPRRSKSSDALDERARHVAVDRATVTQAERKPGKRTKFYCTFCQKRFHSRSEWMRHEQTIHMPEELWICCPRIRVSPSRCPFCEQTNPSRLHLADHNYFTCQAKPLSERTFGRQDHFLQHISQVHKVSPGQKPARLTELVKAWRHPLSLKEGHQALHCGFCGLTFENYQERTRHVSQHFLEGVEMMSWWKDRVNHDVDLGAEHSSVSNR